jgi:uroporphyrinogen-III synthase
MTFSHVFITRPRQASEELADLLSPLGLHPVIQPAFVYFPVDPRASQAVEVAELEASGQSDLVIFTSPRAVVHGIAQLSPGSFQRARVGAIGPATSRALAAAGIRVGLVPAGGYTSEDLLETLSAEGRPLGDMRRRAFIIAAPGGRKKLRQGLEELGWQCRSIMVYRPEPAELDKEALAGLKSASGLLSVWTSANAMKALSQRLPPAIWFQICQGEWLVISERLRRLARAYGPRQIHLAAGPGNPSLLSSIRSLL